MKKYLIALVLCVLALTASAQVFTAEQIERYAKDKYGDNWTEECESNDQSYYTEW